MYNTVRGSRQGEDLLNALRRKIFSGKFFVGQRDFPTFLDEANFVFPLDLCPEFSLAIFALNLPAPLEEPTFTIGRPPSYVHP